MTETLTVMTRRSLLPSRRSRAPLALVALLAFHALPAHAGQDGVPPGLPAAGVPAPERVAWFAKFQDARSGPESIETITRTFNVGPDRVTRHLQPGRPDRRQRHRGDQIVLTAVKRVRGTTGDAKAQLDAIVIDVAGDGRPRRGPDARAADQAAQHVGGLHGAGAVWHVGERAVTGRRPQGDQGPGRGAA